MRDAFNTARLEHKFGSSKDICKTVNTILSTSTSSEVQSIFEIYELETSDSSFVAHNFNDDFASVGCNLAANFDDEYKYLITLGERLENDFFFTPLSVNDVKTIIDSMKNSAPCCDEIPREIYKEYY